MTTLATRRLIPVLLIAATLAASGCGQTRPSTFYTLSSLRAPASGEAAAATQVVRDDLGHIERHVWFAAFPAKWHNCDRCRLCDSSYFNIKYLGRSRNWEKESQNSK